MRELRILIIFLFLGAIALPAEVSASSVIIGGTPYLDVYAFEKNKNFQYAWDPVAKNVKIEGPEGDARFHVGSEFMLSQRKLIALGGKTRHFQGKVVVPISAQTYLEGLSARKVEPVAAPLPVPAGFVPTHRLQKIMIDAGHGGQDYGAISPRGTREKEVALEVAHYVKQNLRRMGFEVEMTRRDDVFIPLSERAQKANSSSADLFVSIHANAAPTASLKGFEIYYLSEATDDAALAVERAENSTRRFETGDPAGSDKALRTILWDLKETENRRQSLRAAEQVVDSVENAAVISGKRIRSANFYVLKWAECPAILVELGYLTNEEDEERLKDPEYQRRLADGIAEGLFRYKSEYENSDGFTR